MQDKIFKVKIFEVTHKSVKVFSLEIFRLYGTTTATYYYILLLPLLPITTVPLQLLLPITTTATTQWRSYTPAHPGTGLGINLFGPDIKNWQESRDNLLINGS